MANPDTNTTSKDTRLINQGARPTERDENSRINLVDEVTGESYATENSENQRIATVVYPS